MKYVDIDKRWKTLTENKLHFRCLKKNHHKFKCRTRKFCGISGCKLFHYKLLHKDVRQNSHCYSELDEVNSEKSVPRSKKARVQLRLLTVWLHRPKGFLKTLGDEPSFVTLLDEKIARQLGLTGPIESLCLQ